MMAEKRDTLQALVKSWHREIEAAVTYRALAERETDSRRRDILQKLVTAEQEHAAKWAARIRELGGAVPDPSTVKSALGLTLQLASPEVIYRKLEAIDRGEPALAGE